MKSTSLLIALGTLVASSAVAQNHRVPITDPVELESMGFPADATNVWRLVGDDDAKALLPRGPEGSFEVGLTKSNTVTAEDFVFTSAQADYFSADFSEFYCPTGSANRIASAAVKLPDDRRLRYLDVWGRDNLTTEAITAYLYETCQSQAGPPDPSNTILAQVDSPDTAALDYASWDPVPDGVYSDNFLCTYSINLVLGEGPCDGSLLKFYKARVVFDTD